MSEVQHHYNNLFEKHYTWMFGTSFAAKAVEQKTILEDALPSAADDVELWTSGDSKPIAAGAGAASGAPHVCHGDCANVFAA
jgi:hypothetical protein